MNWSYVWNKWVSALKSAIFDVDSSIRIWMCPGISVFWLDSNSKYKKNSLLLYCFYASRKNNTTTYFLFKFEKLIHISN